MYKKLQNKHEEVIRQLHECEQLSIAGNAAKSNGGKPEPNKDESFSYPLSEGSTTLYYLQPATDGRFRAVNMVNNAADALYALTYQNDNPSEATLKFIDTKENALLAVQNESNWILVACERSNVPTEQTTSIRTDVPGKAVLSSGEWEIIQKARITYR
jgi:hypothetical protein